MIIPAYGDADLLKVLFASLKLHIKLANSSNSSSILPMTLLSSENALGSAFGNACE